MTVPSESHLPYEDARRMQLLERQNVMLLEALEAMLADNERAYPADLGNVAASMARSAIAAAKRGPK